MGDLALDRGHGGAWVGRAAPPDPSPGVVVASCHEEYFLRAPGLCSHAERPLCELPTDVSPAEALLPSAAMANRPQAGSKVCCLLPLARACPHLEQLVVIGRAPFPRSTSGPLSASIGSATRASWAIGASSCTGTTGTSCPFAMSTRNTVSARTTPTAPSR